MSTTPSAMRRRRLTGRRHALARLVARPQRIGHGADHREREGHASPEEAILQQGNRRCRAVRPGRRGALQRQQVVVPAQVQGASEQRDHRNGQRYRGDECPAAAVRPRGEPGQHHDGGHEEQCGVLGADGERRHRRGEQVHRPAERRGTHRDPRRHSEQAEGRGIVGGEVPEEDRRFGDGEDHRSAEADPLIEEPAGQGVQQGCGGQHGQQADVPGGGQPAPCVRESAQDRVENGRAGKERGVIAGKRHAIEQIRQFLVSRGQVQSLVGERGVMHAQRQDCLHGEDREEDCAAHPLPAAAGLREPGATRAVPAAARRGEHPGLRGWLVARQGAASDRIIRTGPHGGVRLDLERGQHHGLGFRPGGRPVAPPGRPGRRGFRPGWTRLPRGWPGPLRG